MNITKAEHKRIRDATFSKESPWVADVEDYAVFPGDMRHKAEEMGEIEDILWKSEPHEPGNERFLLVNLDGDIEDYISPDYSDLKSLISLFRERHSDLATEKGADSEEATKILDKIRTLEQALEIAEDTSN